MDLQPGVMVTPNVELLQLIGQGGMGSVWVANHLTLQTRVAVKFIASERARHNAKDLARFQREATLAARMRSPHAVQIYDHGLIDDSVPYIVMELLEGETLSTRLKRGPLTLRETAIVMSQAAQALGRAHDQGVVHRDVKPGNLFLIDSGYELFVKVLDFGVAKEMYLSGPSEVTTAGALVGTPAYMSPEQIVGARVTPYVDSWALAVCAYRALTLELPFDAATIGGLAIKLSSGEFIASTKLRPELPPEVDAFFERAFSPNLRERVADVREMARSFANIAGLGDAIMVARLPGTRSVISQEGEKDSGPHAVAPTVTPEATVTRDPDLTPSESASTPTMRSDTPPPATEGATRLVGAALETTDAPSTLSVAGRRRSSWPWGVAALTLAAAIAVWLSLSGDDDASPTTAGSAEASEEASVEPSATAPPSSAEPATSVDELPETSGAPPSSTATHRVATKPTSIPAPTALPSAERGGCTRFDPVAGKKVYHKVCPE